MTTDIPADLAQALAAQYELRSTLGRGGMATVYLAHDRKHRREVALKVLLPGLAAILGVERFLKEIQVVARLNHPHVLALHDSGEAGGFLFYVMPFVDTSGPATTVSSAGRPGSLTSASSRASSRKRTFPWSWTKSAGARGTSGKRARWGARSPGV